MHDARIELFIISIKFVFSLESANMSANWKFFNLDISTTKHTTHASKLIRLRSCRKRRFYSFISIIYYKIYYYFSFDRREFGLERFLPPSLMENMKRKELRRLIGHFMKLNQQMTGSSKMLTQLQVKALKLSTFSSYTYQLQLSGP